MSRDKVPRSAGSLTGAGATHVGQRALNEDAWLLGDSLALVADGVGGLRAGEVASAMACEVTAREIATGETLESAIASADHEIQTSERAGGEHAGMASTIVAAYCEGEDFQLAWVGDSRAYLWDGKLHLLTADHSQVHEQWSKGRLSLEETRRHPEKHVISQALGKPSAEGLIVEFNCVRLGRDACLLLCSDGLSDVLDPSTIAAALGTAAIDGDLDMHSRERKLQAVAETLVASAAEAGGRDNITAVLVAGRLESQNIVSTAERRIWSFDLATGEYSGLPQRAAASPLLGDSVRPVAPRPARSRSPNVTEDLADAPPAKLPGSGLIARASRWRTVWFLLAAIVAIAASILFVNGPAE